MLRCEWDMRRISLLIRVAGIRSRANGWFTLTRKFIFTRMSPTNHFCIGQWCLTTLSLTLFTKRNFLEDFLQVKCNFTRKTAFLRFWAPPPGDLGATYDVHLRLIGKLVVDFLLVIIELSRYVLRLRRCPYIVPDISSRSSEMFTYVVPWTRTRLGDHRSFTVASPRMWNKLPSSMHFVDNYTRFRRLLTPHYLFDWDCGTYWHFVFRAPCIIFIAYLLILK